MFPLRDYPLSPKEAILIDYLKTYIKNYLTDENHEDPCAEGLHLKTLYYKFLNLYHVKINLDLFTFFFLMTYSDLKGEDVIENAYFDEYGLRLEGLWLQENFNQALDLEEQD